MAIALQRQHEGDYNAVFSKSNPYRELFAASLTVFFGLIGVDLAHSAQ
jgi:hypothetical protein